MMASTLAGGDPGTRPRPAPYGRPMGIFRRKASTDTPTTPVQRGSCACPEHVADLTALVVPWAPAWGRTDTDGITVGDLVVMEALAVTPDEAPWHDLGAGERLGPFQWELWLGDEVRATYDDDADLAIDDALRQRPGIDAVEWEDREVFHLAAPTLCAEGVLAAAARALLDPRVRQ
jgi:hypothetical protein